MTQKGIERHRMRKKDIETYRQSGGAARSDATSSEWCTIGYWATPPGHSCPLADSSGRLLLSTLGCSPIPLLCHILYSYSLQKPEEDLYELSLWAQSRLDLLIPSHKAPSYNISNMQILYTPWPSLGPSLVPMQEWSIQFVPLFII